MSTTTDINDLIAEIEAVSKTEVPGPENAIGFSW